MASLARIVDEGLRGPCTSWPLARLFDALLRRNLDLEFADRFPADRAHELAEWFRDLYITLGVPGTFLLPGAAETVDLLRASGARTVVVTAKYEPNAHRCLDQVGLAVDAVYGWRYGPGKAEALRECAAHAYLGDTPRDMHAARDADALAVGVTTGPHDDAELWVAGADVVLSSLVEFPAWWATQATRPDRGG